MSKALFNYDGKIIHFQCNPNDKMKDICKSFTIKNNMDINSLYFLYNGDKLKEDLTFEENLNKDDKERNEMYIIVKNINLEDINNFIIKLK